TVTFTSSKAGTFSSGGTCTLPISGTNSCSVSYTPAAGSEGTGSAHGCNPGTTDHSMPSGAYTVTATKRTSATSVACTPSSLPLNSQHTSPATLSLPASPTRRSSDLTVTFTSSKAGTFSSGGTCTLPISGTNSCSVSYTPAAGSEEIGRASCRDRGDSDDGGVAGADTVTATKRTSATSVACTPSSVPVNSGTTRHTTANRACCSAARPPDRTVTFTSSKAGTFSSGGTCTLPISGTNSCSVSYTPAAGSE